MADCTIHAGLQHRSEVTHIPTASERKLRFMTPRFAALLIDALFSVSFSRDEHFNALLPLLLRNQCSMTVRNR